MEEPRPRPAVRLVVLDEDGRILLLRYHASDTGDDFWATPGGELDPGESWEDAARRELREETGLDVAPGPCIWTREHVFDIAAGPFTGSWAETNRFHLVRTRAFTPEPSGLSEFEVTSLTGHRWWSADELEAEWDEHDISPPELPRLLRALLRDGPPPEPIALS